jgi:transposase-like protein
MPLTATPEEIKAYQEKVEKGKITPGGLDPCPRCNLEPGHFKIHAYRERRFLIIIEMLVQAVFCTLVRFKCSRCGKTFAFYPDFAVPHKHYTRQTVVTFSRSYVQDDQKTYEDAVMTVDGVPECSEKGRPLAPSTIHRWISTLAGIFKAYQEGKEEPLQEKASSRHCKTPIPKKKYRTLTRKEVLLKCRGFLGLSPVERLSVFSPSLQ